MNNTEKLTRVDESINGLHTINVKLTGIDPIYDVTIRKQLMTTIESLMEWHQWLRNNINAT